MQPAKKLVDLDGALDALGITREDYQEFLGDLRAYLAEEMIRLDEFIRNGRLVETRESAHAIKGALRNLHFLVAGDLAYELENVAATRAQGDPTAIFQELRSTLDKSWAWIEAEGLA